MRCSGAVYGVGMRQALVPVRADLWPAGSVDVTVDSTARVVGVNWSLFIEVNLNEAI